MKLRVDHDYVSTAGFNLSNSTPRALCPAIDDTYTELIVRVPGRTGFELNTGKRNRRSLHSAALRSR
jgi:hypothetical protein